MKLNDGVLCCADVIPSVVTQAVLYPCGQMRLANNIPNQTGSHDARLPLPLANIPSNKTEYCLNSFGQSVL